MFQHTASCELHAMLEKRCPYLTENTTKWAGAHARPECGRILQLCQTCLTYPTRQRPEQRCLCHACRGLRTALVEREDFAAGTSSRSTKLVHGGVRYLEKAVWKLDYGQLKLVFEALQASALMWLDDSAAAAYVLGSMFRDCACASV